MSDHCSSAVAPPAGVRAGGFLPELEALRGIAVLLVVAFHADRSLVLPLEMQGIDTRRAVTTPWQAFIRSGDTGVSLFFVLSGFLLALPFLAEARGGRRVDRRHYARRRALRILPLYWTLLAATAVFCVATGQSATAVLPYTVFANGLLVDVPHVPPFTNVVWSLATEAQFYVLLPFLPAIVARPRLAGGLLLLYAAAYGLWLARLLPASSLAMTFQIAHSVFGRGWVFLAGIAAAWVYGRHGDALRARAAATPWLRNGGGDALLVLVLVALGLLLLGMLRFSGAETAMPPLVVWHVPEGICWALVVLLLLLAPLRIGPVLCNRPLMGLGVLSYSIYLWHLPVLKALLFPVAHRLGLRPAGWNVDGVIVTALVLPVILAGSTLTYLAVERPFLRRKQRVTL